MDQFIPVAGPSQDDFDTMSDQIANVALRNNGLLSGDVITVAGSLPIGISYYTNSNNPTNCPTNCKWGAYLFLKSSNTSVTIFYTDQSHIASTYAVDPTTASSITWHIA